GTAKPSAEERARVPHHLIDVADLTESFDAAQFVRRARQALAEIQWRGMQPILCGGTGLFFQAFLEGLGQGPAADPAVRAQVVAYPRGHRARPETIESVIPPTRQPARRQMTWFRNHARLTRI